MNLRNYRLTNRIVQKLGLNFGGPEFELRVILELLHNPGAHQGNGASGRSFNVLRALYTGNTIYFAGSWEFSSVAYTESVSSELYFFRKTELYYTQVANVLISVINPMGDDLFITYFRKFDYF
jgi:hypothetical protein